MDPATRKAIVNNIQINNTFKSTWNANLGFLAYEKQTVPILGSPHAVGRQHGAHGRSCNGFSHPHGSAMLCHFQMHTWDPSPICISPKQCPTMCTIGQEAKAWSGRKRKRWDHKASFLSDTFHSHTLLSYQEPVDHGTSPASLFLIYMRYLKSNTFTLGKQ